jgi:hypothetical protein
MIAWLLVGITLLASHPYIEIRRGQSPEVCAIQPDYAHPAAHWHATFFFNLVGQRQPGDTLTIAVANHRFIFSDPKGAVTLDFPAGLGRHEVYAEWTRGLTSVAKSESSLGVYNCE